MTEADRELLEKAAKAAGIDLTGRKFVASDAGGWYVSMEPSIKNWNPLRDDGDAFRLMVRLEIDLCVSIGGHACAGCPPVVNYIEVPLGSGPAASTRRAIVRAAAAIQETREAV